MQNNFNDCPSETLCKTESIAWLVWVIAAIYYSYEFFIRISPAVMVPDLMASFKVNAAALGMLSGSYYYAYAIMQIPVGALIDRFHVRILLFFAALMVALACLLFSHTNSFLLANIARIIMGIGSAFAFIGCLKLAASWFSTNRFALVVGLTNMLGVLGAISAEAPLASLVNHIGWQHTLFYAAIIGLVIALLILIIIRDHPKQNQPQQRQNKPRDLWRGLMCIIKFPQTWLIAIVGGLMVAPVAGFTELWSVPFLMKAHAVSRTMAAGLASIMFIGIAIGGPVHGLLSGRLQQRKIVIMFGAACALIILSAVLYLPLQNIYSLAVLLFSFGFFISSMLLCFTMNKENNPSWATGVSIGFTNMLVMSGGTIFQPLIGYILDKVSGGLPPHDPNAFTLANYHSAFSLLPLCLIAAIIILCFVKESYPRS